MKKGIKAAAAVLAVGLGLTGCGGGKVIINGTNIENSVEASGVIKQFETAVPEGTYSISVGGGNFIDFNGSLIIDETLEDKIIIQADDNVLDNFTADVDSDGKTIDILFDSKELFSGVKASITIGVPVESMTVSGVYRILYNECRTENITVNLSGSCSGKISGSFSDVKINSVGSPILTIDGTAERLMLSAAGSSQIFLGGLDAKEAMIELSGSAEALICVSDKLDVTATGSSKAEYIGSPEITQNLSGSAELIEKIRGKSVL